MRTEIGPALGELTTRLEAWRTRHQPLSESDQDHAADVAVFAKGIDWALRYDLTFETADIALLKKALERLKERVEAISNGQSPWASKKGRVVRGFVSAIDGSTQPYGLVVPRRYNPARPIRLDVVLHGSSKPVGMSELRFMNRFDDDEYRGR